jgi:hypothetical protein
MLRQTITTEEGTYTITYPTSTTNLGGNPLNAPTAFATVGNSPDFMVGADNVITFEQVTGNGRYLHKIKIMGTSGPGAQITFYAEPVFEIQYNAGVAQFVTAYRKNIIVSENDSDFEIQTQDNGFRIQVNGPQSGFTYFTAILDLPELVSETIIAIPTVYELMAGQADLETGDTEALELAINNGAISGGVLNADELPDGTYDMVANIKSQQYPQDFEVNITKRFIVSNSFASVVEDEDFYDLETVADNTDGAEGNLLYDNHPISNELGVYVTATGWSTPSKFEGTLTVTPVLE